MFWNSRFKEGTTAFLEKRKAVLLENKRIMVLFFVINDYRLK
jgi:hypothetical protein